MTDLEQLARHYNTDKADHAYLPHYEKLFAGFRDQPITLLEIGVAAGASLRMWRDYFPQGQIHGIDATEESMFEEERIKTYLGRQEDTAFLKKIVCRTGPLDVVVDDGSHEGAHEVVSFLEIWPHVKAGGWYCIEDCFSLFNECWTRPDDPTILSMLAGRWNQILTAQGDIAEVRIIGGGINDGLIVLERR